MERKAETAKIRTSPVGEPPAAHGFTLLELLVVLSLIGLLLVLLPSALVRVLPSTELKASARDVASLLREARSMAIQENSDAAVVVDTGSGTLRVQGANRSERVARGIAVTLTTARSEQLSDRSGRIRFYPDGTSTGGNIKLSGKDQTYYVVVDWLSGRITIRR